MQDLKSFITILFFSPILNVISAQEFFMDEKKTMDKIKIAALGRVASIGELYDVRTDKFLLISMTKNHLPVSMIETTETKHSNIEYLKLKSSEEELSYLNIQNELKLSVLSGLIEVGGPGKILSHKKFSSKSVQLAAFMTTQFEHVDFTHENVRKLIALDILEKVDATHVVVGIQWGANEIISIEDSNNEGSLNQNIQENIIKTINKLVALVKAGKPVNETIENEVSKYAFEIYGDILPTAMPVTLIAAVKLMIDSEKSLIDSRSGKGTAMFYTLLPLDVFRQLLGVEASVNSILKSVSESIINAFVKLFDEMNDIKEKLTDLLDERKKFQNYITKEKLNNVDLFSNAFDNYHFNVKERLAELLITVRSGEESIDQLLELLNKTNDHELSPQNIDFEQFLSIQTEFKFLNFLSDLRVTILNKQTRFGEFMSIHFNKNIYAFFYAVDFPTLSENPLFTFRRILDKRETFDSNGIFVAIKMDVLDKIEKETYFDFLSSNKSTRMRLYKNNICLVDDYSNDTNAISPDEPELWSIDYMKTQLYNIMKNPVPIGYVYVQYSNMPEPMAIWHQVKWRDITSKYAGLFFRAEGESSNRFEEGNQDDISPRITKFNRLMADDQVITHENVTLTYSDQPLASLYLTTGNARHNTGGYSGINVEYVHNEVIPKNQAIRIWKRFE